jgi:hypothetical protein
VYRFRHLEHLHHHAPAEGLGPNTAWIHRRAAKGGFDLRQDLWRAGHAHAGVWLVLSLVTLRYVDEATLSEGMRWVVRLAFPAAAVLMALAFFLSVLSPEATEPNAMIYLAYVAGVVLAVGLLVLAVGLVRRPLTPREA